MKHRSLGWMVLFLAFFLGAQVVGCGKKYTAQPIGPFLVDTDTPTETFTATTTFTQPASTDTPTPSPSDTDTWTITPTDTFQLTDTDTLTPTETPTSSMTDTEVPTPTFTPTMSETDTATELPTSTETPTDTGAETCTPTETYTPTETCTPTDTGTSTWTGTPTFTRTQTLTHTPFVIPPSQGDFNLSGGVTTLAKGLYSFDCVNIAGGTTVTIDQGVTIFCKCFTLDAGGVIEGVGEGYNSNFEFNCHQGYQGPGPGDAMSGGWACQTYWIWFSAGGGHGGAGGSFCPVITPPPECTTRICSTGGKANDDPVYPTEMGSSGAFDLTNSWCDGSSGGALLKVVVYDSALDALMPATVNGTINMSGEIGASNYLNRSGGGGAGGTILIEASSVDGTGVLRADGGHGAGVVGGGGGGGGIISLIENLTSFTGTISVQPGAGGDPPAQPGIITFTTAPATGY